MLVAKTFMTPITKQYWPQNKRPCKKPHCKPWPTNTQWIENTDALLKLGELGTKPTTYYKTETEAIRHSSELENIQHKIDTKRAETDPYAEQLAEHTPVDVGVQPVTHYDTETQAIEHRSRMNTLLTQNCCQR